MSGRRFFSGDWPRVEAMRPRLRSHLRLSRHRYRNRPAYVISDPLTGKNHRLTLLSWRFVALCDGQRSVDQIWRSIAAESGEAAPSQDQTIDLLGQLHQANLLTSDAIPDLAELMERRRKQVGQIWRRNLLSPMSIRLPLFNPEPLLDRTAPFLRGLIGPAGFLMWCGLVLSGLVNAAIHWDAIVSNIPDRVLSAGNLAGYLLIYVVIKILHEFGHGAVATRYGAPVREFGIMLLVFVPVPYVDASAANALPDKWQRAAVAAAGILVETAIAAVAVHLWVVLEPGSARALAHDAILVAGLSTVLVNANPLLKFDGYFVLSDILEIPNLATRANRYWTHLTETRAFGLEARNPPRAGRLERAVFLVYAPAAFVYRILLSLGIALFIAAEYFIFGILLGLWSVTLSLVVPVIKALWKVVAGPVLQPRRRRAVAVTFGGIGLVALGLAAVPLPLSTVTQGVIWLPEEARLRVGAPGRILSVEAQAGQSLTAGAAILRLENDMLVARLATEEARLRALELREMASRGSDPVLADQVRADLVDGRERAARAGERVAALHLAAAGPGRFMPAFAPADAPGRYLREGDEIGWLLPDRLGTVRVVLDQDGFARAQRGIRRIELRPSTRPEQLWPVAGYAFRSGGVQRLPSPALGVPAGGPVPVDPGAETPDVPLERVFLLDVDLPPEARMAPEGPVRAGMRFHIRIVHPPEPLLPRLVRMARDAVNGVLGP